MNGFDHFEVPGRAHKRHKLDKIGWGVGSGT